MTETEFDPDVFLNSTPTEDELDGKKALTPEGTYLNCTIAEIRPFEPKEWDLEKGVKMNLLAIFDCPDTDVEVSTFIKWKEVNHPMSVFYKLRKAVWPEKEVALTKTVRDLVGELVNITVIHEEYNVGGKQGERASFHFVPMRK